MRGCSRANWEEDDNGASGVIDIGVLVDQKVYNKGVVEEVKVYRGALSQQQIATQVQQY